MDASDPRSPSGTARGWVTVVTTPFGFVVTIVDGTVVVTVVGVPFGGVVVYVVRMVVLTRGGVDVVVFVVVTVLPGFVGVVGGVVVDGGSEGSHGGGVP